jgi:hypothetical protein
MVAVMAVVLEAVEVQAGYVKTVPVDLAKSLVVLVGVVMLKAEMVKMVSVM